MRPWSFTSLDAALAERAGHPPDAQALLFVAADGSANGLSHADLNDRAQRIAHVIAQQGLGPGDVVALLLPHSPERMTG